MSDTEGGSTAPDATTEGTNDAGKPAEYTPPATQEEFDRIVEGRLSRERKKYADYDELKANQAEFDAWKQSQLTEQEKAVQAAREEGSSETARTFQRRLVSSEVKAAAVSAGFNDAADALVVIGDELPLTKDGEPDTEQITRLVSELAEKKPYLIAQATPKRPAGKPKLPGTTRTDAAPNGKGRAAAALRQLGKSRG